MKSLETIPCIFPFNENDGISFKLKLFNRPNSTPIELCADIKYEEGELILYVDIENDKYSALSVILSKEYNKKDFSIKEAYINGETIQDLKIDKKIRFTLFEKIRNNSERCSMSLKRLSFTTNQNYRDTLYRLTTTAELLTGYLGPLFVKSNNISAIEQQGLPLSVFGQNYLLFRDDSHVYLKTSVDPSMFLALTSFFVCMPIGIQMKRQSNKYEAYKQYYKLHPSKGRNDILGFLFVNNTCLNHFIDFFNILKICIQPQNQDEIMMYIKNYIRAENLDGISKVILYTSILDKMAIQNKGKDTYDRIKKYLEAHNIKISVINYDIQQSGLENDYGEPINNFVELRNYFVHHLGNKETEEFIENSDTLFFLKATITVLLLEMLGIKEISFDENFSDISVFSK